MLERRQTTQLVVVEAKGIQCGGTAEKGPLAGSHGAPIISLMTDVKVSVTFGRFLTPQSLIRGLIAGSAAHQVRNRGLP